VPIAIAITLVVIGIGAGGGLASALVVPTLAWTMPTLTWPAVLSLALPLYVVTMASQNVPGAAVLSSYGYDVPWRESLTVTGVGTLAGAMFGGHAINLAAITASMTANEGVHPDPRRRWVAAHAAGWTYLVLGLVSAPLTAYVSAAPAAVIGTVAGLALLGTLAASLHGALAGVEGRDAGTITFVVAASGTVIGGIGAAFWALVAGLAVRALLSRHRVSTA
jgi:benzoate membrane transport protein